MSAAFGSVSGELRQEARACLARARDLLSKNELAATRYACLELRLAIESLAYQQLDSYLNEIPDDAMRKWTPREVIAQMLEVDPKADKSSTIAIGREEEHGRTSKDMKVLGEDRRFTLKWANLSHNALGNFLHVPTLHQTETGKAPDHDTMRTKAEEVAAVIEHTLDTPIYNVNFGNFYHIECMCGRGFKRREGSFTVDQGIVCPNVDCRTIWDVVSEEGTKVHFKQRQTEYVCPGCNETRFVLTQKLKAATIITCDCGARAEVALSLFPIEDVPKMVSEESAPNAFREARDPDFVSHSKATGGAPNPNACASSWVARTNGFWGLSWHHGYSCRIASKCC